MKFLEEHTKMNKDILKIMLTELGKENTTVSVTGGIQREDIMGTIDKVACKISRKKFFDKPIYVYPIRELTPTKPEKKQRSDNSITLSLS